MAERITVAEHMVAGYDRAIPAWIKLARVMPGTYTRTLAIQVVRQMRGWRVEWREEARRLRDALADARALDMLWD